MEAKSIEDLVQEIGVWSNRHTRDMSDSARNSFERVPFELQQAFNGNDYKSLMRIAIECCRIFDYYIDQLRNSDTSSIKMPSRASDERRTSIRIQFMTYFDSVNLHLYRLFISAAQELVRTALDGKAIPLRYYGEIKDGGRYIVITPDVAGFTLVQETYKEGKVRFTGRTGPALVKDARYEKEVCIADLNGDGSISRKRRLQPRPIDLNIINNKLIYALNPSIKIS